MYLVAGITGNVGGAAARQLLENGQSVRALVRDPQKAAQMTAGWARQGVEFRHGDFTDAASIAAALDGVEGAFLMLPPVLAPAPGFPEASAMIDSFREALRRVPPPRLVLLSSIGSERDSGLGLITATHLLEAALGDLPMPTAVVRAGCFLNNFTHDGLERVAATGVFDCFLAPTDRPVPMIAAGDIGKEVARLLAEGWSGRKALELGTAFSPDDLARAMEEALGCPVEARSVPRAEWTARLEAIGLPAGRTGPFEEMWDGVNSGWIDFGAAGTEAVAVTQTPAAFFAAVRKARSEPVS